MPELVSVILEQPNVCVLSADLWKLENFSLSKYLEAAVTSKSDILSTFMEPSVHSHLSSPLPFKRSID